MLHGSGIQMRRMDSTGIHHGKIPMLPRHPLLVLNLDQHHSHGETIPVLDFRFAVFRKFISI